MSYFMKIISKLLRKEKITKEEIEEVVSEIQPIYPVRRPVSLTQLEYEAKKKFMKGKGSIYSKRMWKPDAKIEEKEE